ncbi:MAG: hypothetical protein JNL42_22980 [Anaerolineae bacterium]|nr:hypothetical protein [Anaerolineae bacterium]
MSENRRRMTAMQLAEWLEQFVFSAANGVRAETVGILDRCLESGRADELEALVNRIVMQPETRLDMLSEMAEVVEGRLNELRQLHFERCESLAGTLRALWEIELPAAAVRDLVSGASENDLLAMMSALSSDMDDEDEDPDDPAHPVNQLESLARLDDDLSLMGYLYEFVDDWTIAMEMIAFRSAWEQRGAAPGNGDGFTVAH